MRFPALLPSLAWAVILLTAAHQCAFAHEPSATGRNLTPLFSHIWAVRDSPLKPALGTIYIFLPNGTLLESSCVETYRIATWTVDKNSPSALRVTEDGQLAFIAEINTLTNTTLRWTQNLVRSREKRDMTLRAIEGEFVCPDFRK